MKKKCSRLVTILTDMKKIFLFIFCLIFSFRFVNGQNQTDSCGVDSILTSTDTSLFEVHLDSKCDSIKIDTLKTNLQCMEPKKEKFLNTKRIVILTSLVALQVAFGFDPKFTIINLVWLLF